MLKYNYNVPIKFFLTFLIQKMPNFIYPNNTPTLVLECKDAFSLLTDKEKLYAHYLSRASWIGGLIVLYQTSPESPMIFCLLHRLFSLQSVNELEKIALENCNLSEEEFNAFLIYACAVFTNLGNFKGFGDTKFVPNLDKEKFEKLIKSSKLASKFPDEVKNRLSECLNSIYSHKDGERQLGYPTVGITTYLSKNITEEDNETAVEFLKRKNIEAYNTRLFKSIDSSGNISYEIRLASVLDTAGGDETNLLISETINSRKFRVTRGDYSEILKLVNKNLLLAKEHTANENQSHMIDKYIESFYTGSLKAHKDGSRFWVKDISPVVESYIGFIETYRDPAGIRGEFEGFVAMVNRPVSMKYAELVRCSEQFIALLPWPSSYEKDKFLKPDFTSLDVLSFASNDCPIGINIPNYDDIRQSEGFKNVSLANLMSVRDPAPTHYLGKREQELFEKYYIKSLEITTGLHELLGHGTGKLFQKKGDGFNFDLEKVVHLETGEKISSWYEEGETYDSKFGPFGSPYEECKANCVALYLSTVPDILRLFGYEDPEEQQTLLYVCWIEIVLTGISSLSSYEPKTESWLQAHSQADYVILQVLLECEGNFVQVKKRIGSDGKPDFLFTLDQSKILSHGKPCIGRFLRKLQLYKSTADAASAKAMFDKYSAVTSEGQHPFLEYREIVMSRKKPRRLVVQPNTVLKDGKVVLVNYPGSARGLIQSCIERYQDVQFYEILEELWRKDKHHFE